MGSSFLSISSMEQVRPWIIAFSCFWINLFMFAVFRSGGVLYLALTRTLDCTYSQASWPITLAGAVASITCLPAGFLYHFFAVRTIVATGIFIIFLSISSCFFITSISTMIVVLGVFQGIGIGLITGLLPVIISEYFDKNNRAGAVGLSYSGAAVGAFIFPIVFESLITKFQLQPALLIMGGITLLGIMGAILLTPFEEAKEADERKKKIEDGKDDDWSFPATQLNTETTLKEYSRESSKKNFLCKIIENISQDVKIVTNPYFAMVSIVYIAYIMGNVTFLMILPAFAIEVGLDKSQGILLLSIFSVTDLIGRLTPLVLNYFTPDDINQKKLISNKFLFIASIFMLSLVLLCFPIVASSSLPIFESIKSFIPLYYILMTLTLIAGFFSGFQMILPPVLLSEYLGPSQTAVAFGLCNFICGIVSFSRPFIIEGIKKWTNSYDLIFYIFGSFAFLTAICWICEIIWTSNRNISYGQVSDKQIET